MDFFVGGCAKSGTTLLNAILCSDPATNPRLPECDFLLNAVEAVAVARQSLQNQGTHYFSSERSLVAFGRRWIPAWLDEVRAKYPEARHLVLKHPRLTTLFHYLALLMPEARFLVIARDPRDVAAAYYRVHDRMTETGTVQGMFARNAAAIGPFIANHYAPVLAAGQQGLGARFMALRYEDLVTDSAPVLDRIRTFTGLALADSRPDRAWQEKRPEGLNDDPNSPWHSELWGQPVTADRIGTYTESLSPAEIETIERACARMMAAFRYPRHGKTPANQEDFGDDSTQTASRGETR